MLQTESGLNVTASIHPLILDRVMVGVEPIPATTVQEAGHTLDRSLTQRDRQPIILVNGPARRANQTQDLL